MSEKQAFHIALPPEVHRKLRVMAANQHCSIGDIITHLVDIDDGESGAIEGTPEFQATIDELNRSHVASAKE